MEENNIAVSIIMPVYNSERYLRTCIKSILSQDYNSFELLLIDDGSTDGSPAICDEIAGENKRVKVFHKENGGICEARNYGMQRAIGEYIAFSDHDDAVLPGFLRDNFQVAKENNADIVKFGRRGLLIRDEKQLTSNNRTFADETLTHEQAMDRFLDMRIKGAMNCVWDGFFRNDFLKKNNIWFDTRYKKGGEDIDFCSRCFVNAEKIVLRSAIYYEHYIRIGISTSTIEDPERMIKFERLGDNLIQCIPDGVLNTSAHKGQYDVLVARDEIYPSVKYMLSNKKKLSDIRTKVKDIYDKRDIKQVTITNLHKASSKWWLFTSLLMKKQFFLLIIFVKLHMFMKKAGGIS